MKNQKAFLGLRNASPEKRYKSFLNTVVDREQVWLINSEKGFVTINNDGVVYVLIWPRAEYSDYIILEDEKPFSMEIHAFLKKCHNMEENAHFMVFPTERDAYVVTAGQLYSDIKEHLEEVE